MKKFDLIAESEEQEEVLCKGLYFRAKANIFFSNGRYVNQESMTLLKRKSCPGCEQCGYLLDTLHEECCNATGGPWSHYSNPPEIIDFEHGKMYTLRVEVDSTDWETGYADDFHLQFVPVKEETS